MEAGGLSTTRSIEAIHFTAKEQKQIQIQTMGIPMIVMKLQT
jgi:hypothetical protein